MNTERDRDMRAIHEEWNVDTSMTGEDPLAAARSMMICLSIGTIVWAALGFFLAYKVF